VRVGAWQGERRGGALRLSARITWEDRDRADDTLWFEWPEALAESVRAEADAALVALYPLAMYMRERRLKIDGAVTSRLGDGVRSAMAVIAEQWPAHQPVALDITHGRGSRAPGDREAAVCFSGGVDALAAVQANVSTTPVGASERYASALFVFGLNTFDFVEGMPSAERLVAHELHAARLAAFVESLGMTLLRCSTNLRSLFPSFDAWWEVASTSYLAAVGHLMRPRIASLAMGSAGRGSVVGVSPHPLIDALHATDALSVHGAQAMMTRLEKVRRLTVWPDGLAVLRVCLLIDLPDGGRLNCGTCEKCVRTMLELIAIGDGALARAPFPVSDVDAGLVGRALGSSHGRAYVAELAPMLVAQGRNDLADALTHGLRQHARTTPAWWQRWRA
jgi:hypothetical protein